MKSIAIKPKYKPLGYTAAMTETVVGMPEFDLNWPKALGEPEASADFRTQNEDFMVYEELGFEPEGEGEHVFLQICKRGENTAWVAKQIARLANVKPMDVGYSGLKDRHAVTTQWFSVYLGNKPEADWQALTSETVTVLQVGRHPQKLRRGMHACNRFTIKLRNFTGDQSITEQRLHWIRAHGVPNYFGDQRFGRGGGNLPQAQRLLVDGERIRDKQLRGLILSAARSYLFNLVLASRIRTQTWLQLLEGDVAVDGFSTGPLWGRGRSLVTGDALALETEALQDFSAWTDALEYVGLSQERRALVMPAGDLTWKWQEQDLVLEFSLGSGCFATALLREVLMLRKVPFVTDQTLPSID